jgi:hypothetical protein
VDCFLDGMVDMTYPLTFYVRTLPPDVGGCATSPLNKHKGTTHAIKLKIHRGWWNNPKP